MGPRLRSSLSDNHEQILIVIFQNVILDYEIECDVIIRRSNLEVVGGFTGIRGSS